MHQLDGGNKLVQRWYEMAEAERITARQRAILTAVIESYIETGEPVGSGTIAGTIARVQAGGGHGRGAEPGDGAQRDGGAGE